MHRVIVFIYPNTPLVQSNYKIPASATNLQSFQCGLNTKPLQTTQSLTMAPINPSAKTIDTFIFLFLPKATSYCLLSFKFCRLVLELSLDYVLCFVNLSSCQMEPQTKLWGGRGGGRERCSVVIYCTEIYSTANKRRRSLLTTLDFFCWFRPLCCLTIRQEEGGGKLRQICQCNVEDVANRKACVCFDLCIYL